MLPRRREEPSHPRRARSRRHISEPQGVSPAPPGEAAGTRPVLSAECIRWKYFQHRADYPGPRSWAYRGRDGEDHRRSGHRTHHVPVPASRHHCHDEHDDRLARRARIGAAPVRPRLMQEVTKDLPLRFAIGRTDAAKIPLKRQEYAASGTLETFRKAFRPWRGVPRRASADEAMASQSARARLGDIQRLPIPRRAAEWSAHASGPSSVRSKGSCEAPMTAPGNAALPHAGHSRVPAGRPANCKAFLPRHKGSTLGYVLMSHSGLVCLWHCGLVDCDIGRASSFYWRLRRQRTGREDLSRRLGADGDLLDSNVTQRPPGEWVRIRLEASALAQGPRRAHAGCVPPAHPGGGKRDSWYGSGW